ncbi:MFS transporter [Pedobacter heparinus]|uniref:MFS transporter n=1 Tax=Pedobacter heparinus TaxID=984 RepID=UPI00292E43B7|nr:MFS transporter [Pedobacter heparinus]
MFNKKIVFLSACFGMLLFGVTLITLGSVAPMLIGRFNLDQLASGTLFSILPFGVLTGSLLFGPFCDKYGYKYLLAFSALLIGIGFEGIAFSSSFLWLKVCIFLFGLGGGAINGATNAVVADISIKDKGANLSLIGVFFGLGALGMPFILGFLENVVSTSVIVASVGLLAFLAAAIFGCINFPLPKHINGFPIRRGLALLKDRMLMLIALFLFCQCSFEAIVNNWTTTYLIKQIGVSQSKALYALSLFVVGMTLMRLLMGSVLRNLSIKAILTISFVLLLAGIALLNTSVYLRAIAGLVLMGGGLAAGFPVMLGIVATRYADLSATAFSLVLVMALFGNMVVNYLMGMLANTYGIRYLIYMALAELILMTLLGFLVLGNQKNKQLKI